MAGSAGLPVSILKLPACQEETSCSDSFFFFLNADFILTCGFCIHHTAGRGGEW